MEDKINLLKKNGWYVSLEKVSKQFQITSADSDKVDSERLFLRDPEKWLSNQDLKNIGIPCIPDGVNSGKTSQISTPIVLQVKKIEIISAPKRNTESEAAPRMLKITLTDGKTCCYGVENDHIPRLSLKTPPGTKVRLTGTVKTLNGFLLLDSKNVHLVGGEVPELIEEWQIQQLLLGHVRTQDRDGPPPWVPFGRKIQPLNIDETKTKKAEEEEKVVKDEGFLNQRQDAIAAAASASGITKVIMGSGRQLEMHQPERRGRGRERRERNSYRDEERSAKPRDSIRLFEFLQPQIGESGREENEADLNDDSENEYAAQEAKPNWQREGHHRRGHRGPREERGQRGSRGRGPRDARETREYPLRSSHQDHDWRGIRSGTTDRGRNNYDPDAEQSYNHRGQSSHRRNFSRGSRRGNNSGGRGYHRDIEDSHTSHGGYSSRRSPVDALVDDFNAWPGLDSKPPGQASTHAREEIQVGTAKSQEQWTVEDFCLAKWEASQQYYPAVIQQLHQDRKSATVMFVESGAVRLVETKYLRRDPHDEGYRPDTSNRSRGKQATRIYTPRNRGMSRGNW